MDKTAFRAYANEHGGRVIVLFLLFLLALYQFIHAGFPAFAIICALPLMVLAVITTFRHQTLTFWVLIGINYILQWHNIKLPSGIPMSMYNEMLELLLIFIALLDVQNAKFERTLNLMFLTLLLWAGFCTLEVLNDTCDLGINVGAWFVGVRMMAYQLIYAFLVFTLYISNPRMLVKYLSVWGALALFSSFWVWKQKYIGFTDAENSWLHGPGSTTHIIQNGTLIRYFSTYSDSANFGIGIASTAVAFIVFGITAKIRKFKIFFLIVGFACAWAMFPLALEQLLPV